MKIQYAFYLLSIIAMILKTQCYENSRRMRHKTRNECDDIYNAAQAHGDRASEISDEIVDLQNALIAAGPVKEKNSIRSQIDAKKIERSNEYRQEKEKMAIWGEKLRGGRC